MAAYASAAISDCPSAEASDHGGSPAQEKKWQKKGPRAIPRAFDSVSRMLKLILFYLAVLAVGASLTRRMARILYWFELM